MNYHQFAVIVLLFRWYPLVSVKSLDTSEFQHQSKIAVVKTKYHDVRTMGFNDSLGLT